VGQFDVLDIGGMATLNGSLTVSLAAGFMPAAGDSFDILDWGTRTGMFANLNLPQIPGLLWDTSALYTNGTLVVVAPLPGDFNVDGLVDAADYVAWRKNGGTPEKFNA
jgi:hypothetical protein